MEALGHMAMVVLIEWLAYDIGFLGFRIHVGRYVDGK